MMALVVFYYEDNEMRRINKEKANKLLTKGAILVDMRSPVAYRDGHITGSQNLPLKNFTNLLMKTDRKKSIIIYGESFEDKDLSHGFNYAEQLGFTEVFATDYETLK
jgi:thiosulfate sulfurtransferase